MNKEIMKQAGFEKEVELVEKGYCPFCKRIVNVNGFRDSVSRKEYEISGLCQACQDETFSY